MLWARRILFGCLPVSNLITSRQNQYLKLVKSLHLKKNRDQHRLFVVEGVRSVEEAVTAGEKIQFALFTEKLIEDARGLRLVEEIKNTGTRIWQVEENLLKDVAGTENPQGIVAVVSMKHYQLEDLAVKKDSMLLLIDGIQDPGNLGTMIRTACAAGAAGIILLKGTVDQYNSKVVRAAMGTLFQVPIVCSDNNRQVLSLLRAGNFRVLVADVSGDFSYEQVNVKGNLAWVLGNEANGPEKFWIEHGDACVRIPIYGPAESLNVAVAAGILLFEAAKKR